MIPLGLIFIFTTNPSEFASSLNHIGVPYKVCTTLSLTLRYFPDIIRDYTNISLAQQARGIELSKKICHDSQNGHSTYFLYVRPC